MMLKSVFRLQVVAAWAGVVVAELPYDANHSNKEGRP
jgi:hypothetical protein